MKTKNHHHAACIIFQAESEGKRRKDEYLVLIDKLPVARANNIVSDHDKQADQGKANVGDIPVRRVQQRLLVEQKKKTPA